MMRKLGLDASWLLLRPVVEQVGILTGQAPKIVLADRGYCGVEPPDGTRLLTSHTRGLPRRLRKLLKRRQVVGPMIGHMKSDGLPLAKKWLKGATGDAMHAILCRAGHNHSLASSNMHMGDAGGLYVSKPMATTSNCW